MSHDPTSIQKDKRQKEKHTYPEMHTLLYIYIYIFSEKFYLSITVILCACAERGNCFHINAVNLVPGFYGSSLKSCVQTTTMQLLKSSCVNLNNVSSLVLFSSVQFMFISIINDVRTQIGIKKRKKLQIGNISEATLRWYSFVSSSNII